MNKHQSTVPKNGWARKTLPPLPATASAEAGQTPKLKEEQPDGKIPSSSPSKNLRVTKTPKEKEEGKGKKWEAGSLAAVPTSH